QHGTIRRGAEASALQHALAKERSSRGGVIPSRADSEGPRRRSSASALDYPSTSCQACLLRVMQSALVRSFGALRQPQDDPLFRSSIINTRASQARRRGAGYCQEARTLGTGSDRVPCGPVVTLVTFLTSSRAA